MILADDNQILERAAQTDAPAQDQFPKPGPGLASEAFTGGLQSTAALPRAVWDGLGTAIDTGADLAHDMLQPGAGHAAASAFQAGVTRAREVDNFTADEYTYRRQYEPVMEAINKDRAPDDQLPNPFDIHLGGYAEAQGVSKPLPNGAMRSRDNVIPLVWARVQQLREQAPQLVANVPANEQELKEDVLAEQRTALAYSDLTSKTTLGKAANLVGGFAGSFTDPPNVLASLLGAPAAASLLRTFLLEGTLNTALDAAGLPSRASRYRALGQPMSKGEIGAELGLDFLLGGGLPTGIKAALHSLFPEVRTAARVVEDEANRAQENPLADTDLGRDQHRQAALSAMTAIEDGRPDQLPDTTGQLKRALDPAIDLERRRDGFVIQSFTPEDLRTAAPAVEGGRLSPDEWDQAVTTARAAADQSALWKARQGELEIRARDSAPDLTAKWDGQSGPLSLWYETADGTRAPLDAPTPYGLTLREAEGVTLRQARAVADLKAHFEGDTNADPLRHAPQGADLPAVGVFQTAKGSTYRVHADGTTSRNKAARSDLGHEGQFGPQPRSERTFYVTPEQADALSLFQTQGERKAIAQRKDGSWGVTYLEGKGKGKFEKRTVISPSTQPSEGLIPVEIFKNGERVHFGNPIVEVRPPVQESGSLSHPPQSRPPLDRHALDAFGDPAEKPEGFFRQSQDLARDLAPERQALSPTPDGEAAKPPEFGPAQDEIEAIRALDQKDSFPDALSEAGEISVRDARRRMEREARAVEALRKCGGFDAI